MASQELITSLQAILSSLVIGENEQRNAAEVELNAKFEADAPGVLMALSLMGTTAEDANLRAFSLLLLRRLSLKAPPQPENLASSASTSTIASLGNDALAFVRGHLLGALPREAEASVRTRLADCVAGLAQAAIDDKHPWGELLPVLVEMTRNPEARIRETAFKIYEDCPGLVADENPEVVKAVFAAALNDPESLEVRLASLKGALAFLYDSTSEVRSNSTEFLGAIFQLMQNIPEDNLATVLQSFHALASVHPIVFLPHIETLLPFLLRVSLPANPEETASSDSPAQPAFELLLTLVDNKPAFFRKYTTTSGEGFVHAAAQVAIQLVAAIENPEDWGQEDGDETEEDGEWSVWGEECLDRIACALGGKAVLPPVWPMVESLLQGESRGWKERYAGLLSIACIAEGTKKIMEPQLGKVLETICPLIHDPHPRVRYALVHCLGQLSTDFEFEIQEKFSEPIITVLLDTLNHPVPRVHAHAASALVNFCEGVENPELLAPYLDQMVKGLLHLLQNGKPFVQEQAITSLAVVASAAEGSFARFYDELMPTLLNVLRSPLDSTDEKARLLRGKVLECCGLIGLAVPDKFRGDALEMANILGAMQALDVSTSDEMLASYIMATWGKLADVLKTDFAPFLPTVMPALLKTASLAPELSVLDGEDDGEDEVLGNDWDVVNVDGQNVGIKTSAIEQVNEAFELLVIYASRLGTAFGPYLEETMTLALKNLVFFFHDEVRRNSAILLPILLATAKEGNVITPQLLIAVFEKLMLVIEAEFDTGVLAFFFKSLADTLRVVGMDNFPQEARVTFEKVATTSLTDISDRRKLRTERAEGWDEEEREEAYELEAEETSAVNELVKILEMLDPNHPLKFVASGVKDLGMAPSDDWEEEE